MSFKWKGIKRKIYLALFNKQLKEKCKGREQKFQEFVSDNFQFSDTAYGWNELTLSAEKYDGVILGSDQVWHPINYGSHYYTMEWVPDYVPKITYAASFGVSSLPKYQINGTKRYLERIDAVSVREEKGSELIETLIGRKPIVVLDPTLLLKSDEWDTVSKPVNNSKYIFCYFLGGNSEARNYAKNIAQEKELPIYAILYMDEINSVDKGFADKEIFDAGPGEFLSLIKNAEYIITDSFHGTVFSIIYHKKFIVFNRFLESKKQSTNSRIDTLLTALHLEERRCDVNSVTAIEEEIDYVQVDDLIDDLRKESLNYFVTVLNKYKLID